MYGADVRLPSSERGPVVQLLRRLLIALAIIAFVTLVAYLGRADYRDGDELGISFVDAVYYATVSVTTTGYGDITPVTTDARLVNILLVTPARVLFLVILVGTTLEVLAAGTRLAIRERTWRSGLRDHTIVCGYGIKGRAAVETLLADEHVERESIVVIDERAEVINQATRYGLAGIAGDASDANVLRAASIEDARAVIVAADRDDTAVLITLTAKELNPRAAVVASVRDATNAHLLRQGGADSVIVSSGAAGRLLGHAVRSPGVVQVLEDLLSLGAGLDLIEREVPPEKVGQPLETMHGNAPVIGVARNGQVLRFDDPRAQRLEAGDRLVCFCSNE